MFKFVVLCALIGAAVADPDPGLLAPQYYSNGLAWSSPYVQPALAPLATTYTSAIPAAYSSPLITNGVHFIKKRSVALAAPSAISYIAPTTYAAASPLYASGFAASPYISSPYINSSPYISSPYINSSPYVSSLPLAYNTLIKK